MERAQEDGEYGHVMELGHGQFPHSATTPTGCVVAQSGFASMWSRELGAAMEGLV